MNFRPDVAANRRPVLALRHLADAPLISNNKLSRLQPTLALTHLADAPLTSNKRTGQRFRPVPKRPSVPKVTVGLEEKTGPQTGMVTPAVSTPCQRR